VAARDASISASVAADEATRPVSSPARPDEQTVPVIPKLKHASKKPAAISCTQAPRLLRKTPAREARASLVVSK
jgi:hypothetical protein